MVAGAEPNNEPGEHSRKANLHSRANNGLESLKIPQQLGIYLDRHNPSRSSLTELVETIVDSLPHLREMGVDTTLYLKRMFDTFLPRNLPQSELNVLSDSLIAESVTRVTEHKPLQHEAFLQLLDLAFDLRSPISFENRMRAAMVASENVGNLIIPDSPALDFSLSTESRRLLSSLTTFLVRGTTPEALKILEAVYHSLPTTRDELPIVDSKAPSFHPRKLFITTMVELLNASELQHPLPAETTLKMALFLPTMVALEPESAELKLLALVLTRLTTESP